MFLLLFTRDTRLGLRNGVGTSDAYYKEQDRVAP